MVDASRLRDSGLRIGRAFLLQACLVAGAGSAALVVRSAVLAERLGDAIAVAVTIGSLAAILAAFAVSVWAAARAVVHRPLHRAGLALAPVLLFVCCGLLVRSVYPETSVEMEAIAQSAAAGPGTVIALGPGGTDVRLSGEIGEGAAARLEALLDANPRVERIHLTSEGGLADEGQAIGDVIAAHALSTFVPDFCVSACTLAFVRGRERFVMRGSRIGFHGPFQEGLFGRTFAGDSSEVRAAYVEAGVQPAFADEALKVQPDDMWFPSAERLIAAHVATATVGNDRFPDSNLDGNPTLAGSRREVLDNFPILAGFAEQAPRSLDRIAGWYLQAYRSGRSEKANVEGLRRLVDGAVATALSHAADATELRVAHFLSRALTAARSPESCFAIGERAELIEASKVLAASAPAHQDGSKPGAMSEAADLVARGIRDGDTMPPLALTAPTRHPVDAGECPAMRRTYASLLARPAADAARALRGLFASRATTELAALRAGSAVALR